MDFYGELLIYDHDSGRVVWRRDMEFGPGIAVDFSPCGRYLAAGGYDWRGRILGLREDGLPGSVHLLDAPSRGVIKSVGFASPTRLLAACGDGSLVVHEKSGDRFVATKALRGSPNMELSNGVAASPDGNTAYVVSRDQSLRAFDLESGREIGCGLAHVRGVKAVHVSEDGETIATASYGRTVMLWSARDLAVRMPPVRVANSGVSGVRCRRGRVFTCSFDGVTSCIDAATGQILWYRTAADVSEGK